MSSIPVVPRFHRNDDLYELQSNKNYFMKENTKYTQFVDRPVGWGFIMYQLHLCRGIRLPQMGPPAGRGWRPVMLKAGVMVDEQSMTCNTPLRPLLRLEGLSETPPPINRLVASGPSTYMIVPTLLPRSYSPYGKPQPFLSYGC